MAPKGKASTKAMPKKSIGKGAAKSKAKGMPKKEHKEESIPDIKTKAEVSVAGQQGLTKEQLSHQEHMTLDDKIAMMREKGDFNMELSPQEWKKLNLRFTQTALPKSPASVHDVWGAISKKPVREGKQAQQRQVLKAFVLDPQFGDKFFSLTMNLVKSESIKEEEQWISRKALLDAMSESEAEEQVRCGSIKVRKNPKCPTRCQFLLTKTVKSKQLEKSSKLSLSGAAQLSEEDFKGASCSFQSLEMDEKLFKKGENLQLLLGNMVESDDEGKPNSSKRSRAPSFSILKGKPAIEGQAGQEEGEGDEGHEEKDVGTQSNRTGKGVAEKDMEGLTSATQGYQKCEKLAQVLESKSVQLRTLQEQMKKSLYGTPKVIGQLKDIIIEVATMKEVLLNLHIHQKASLQKTKERLIEGAKVLKLVEGSIKTNKSILSAEASSQKGV